MTNVAISEMFLTILEELCVPHFFWDRTFEVVCAKRWPCVFRGLCCLNRKWRSIWLVYVLTNGFIIGENVWNYKRQKFAHLRLDYKVFFFTFISFKLWNPKSQNQNTAFLSWIWMFFVLEKEVRWLFNQQSSFFEVCLQKIRAYSKILCI